MGRSDAGTSVVEANDGGRAVHLVFLWEEDRNNEDDDNEDKEEKDEEGQGKGKGKGGGGGGGGRRRRGKETWKLCCCFL